MEEKKIIGSNYGILVIFMFAIICTLTDFIIIDRCLRKYDDKSSVSTEDNGSSSNIVNSIKIDSTKDYVYDSDYKIETKKDSYSIGNNVFKSSDIVVPYVNINSGDAKKVNNELYNLYSNLIEKYNINSESGVSYNTVDYKVYKNSNVLSIVIITTTGGTDVPINNYYTYSFNTNNGKLLSFSDAYIFVGFSDTNIDEKVKSSITLVMSDKLKGMKTYNVDTGDGSYYPEGTNFDTYNNESFDNYKSSINNNIKFYIENNKLNVVVTLSIPAGRGNFDTIITVE